MTKAAFSKIPYLGAPILSFGLLTFAFSTILGWSYYGERSVEYLASKWKMGKKADNQPNKHTKPIMIYRLLYIIAVFVGSVTSLSIVWNMADCMNALMAIPNLLSLLFLSGIVAKETQAYLWNGELDKDMDEE